MKHGNFKGYIFKELAAQAMGLQVCTSTVVAMTKKMNKLSKGLAVLAAGSIVWALDARRRYNRLLERVEKLEDITEAREERTGKTEENRDSEKTGEEEGNEGKAEENPGTSFPEW